MALKSRTRDITITEDKGAFNIFRRFKSEKEEYDFEGITALRRLLSNEKARMIHVIKNKNPSSIYHLAKILNRDFKAVMNDIKLLERFGFIEMTAEKTGKRERHKPAVVVDSVYINIKI